MDQLDQALGDWESVASERRIRDKRAGVVQNPRQRMSIACVDRREQEPRIGWVCSWEKVGADETETVEQRRVSGPWVIERRWNGQPSTP